MKNYPNNYNPIIEYHNQIEKGEVVVSNKVKIVYKELVRVINDEEGEWEYNPQKALHAIKFIEGFCKHRKGSVAGKLSLIHI